MPRTTLDWELVRRVERDICFLYHELAEFPGINGDLAYNTLYPLPYWEYADPDLPEEERRFVRCGCLMLILAMAWECMDGSGTWIVPHLEACRRAATVQPDDDPDLVRLVEVVSLALEHAQRGERASEELLERSVWANRTFVYGYFREKAEQLAAAHARLPRS